MAGAPEPRFDRIGLRIRRTLEYAFAQKRMFRDLYAGVFHIFIFGGFVVLTVRTIELVVDGLLPGFDLLPGRAGDLYTLAKDVFEVLVLVGVAMAVYRRAFARPARLDLTLDAWLVLFLIALLIAADLVAEGAKVARGARAREPLVARRRRDRAGDGRLLPARAPGALRVELVDPPPRHPLLRQLPAVLQALPHLHGGPEHLLHEARPAGPALDAGPREVRALRRVEGRGPHLEVDARRLHLHRVRALPRGLPDGADAASRSTRGSSSPPCATRSTRRRRRSSRRPRAAATGARARPPGPDRRLDLRGHDLGLHDLRVLHVGLPGLHRPGRGQDRGDAAPPRARQGRVPQGDADGVPRHGDQRQSVGDRGRLARRLGEGPAGRDDGARRRGRTSRSSSGSAAPAPTRTARRRSRARSSSCSPPPACPSRSSGPRRPATATPRGGWATSTSSRSLAQQNVETLNGYGVKRIVTNCPHCFNVIRNEYPDFGGSYEVMHGTELVAKLIAAGPPPDGERDPGVDHVPRPLLPRPLQRRVRRAAADPRGDPGARAPGAAALARARALLRRRAAAGCGWRRSSAPGSTRRG